MYNSNFYRRSNPYNNYNSYNNYNDRLFGGGFAGPFILGGITGGLLAPAFYPRPYYYPMQGSYPIYY
jgi:hypothetical protein